mmetsp:Transcript_17243/g.30792  ORF Transcript_17243/g.30792 Transcript_17243/m.30792 type:complete len:236 (-) Transcript_17243:83-790(-)
MAATSALLRRCPYQYLIRQGSQLNARQVAPLAPSPHRRDALPTATPSVSPPLIDRFTDRAVSTVARGRQLSDGGGGGETPDWKEYSLTGSGSRNSCVVMTEDGFELTTDTPKSMGGTNNSAQPVYHLLAALVGCETATAHFVARQMRIRIRGVAFDIKARRDQRGAIHLPLNAIDDFPVPSYLQVVEGQAAVDTDASQEQIDELAHQVHRRCPIASMLIASGCRLDIRWVKATSN